MVISSPSAGQWSSRLEPQVARPSPRLATELPQVPWRVIKIGDASIRNSRSTSLASACQSNHLYAVNTGSGMINGHT